MRDGMSHAEVRCWIDGDCLILLKIAIARTALQWCDAAVARIQFSGSASSVAGCSETFWTAERRVLCFSSTNAFAPHLKRRSFHIDSHELNDLIFWDVKLIANCFESCTVFPGHFDDAVQFLVAEIFQRSFSYCFSDLSQTPLSSVVAQDAWVLAKNNQNNERMKFFTFWFCFSLYSPGIVPSVTSPLIETGLDSGEIGRGWVSPMSCVV